MAAAVNKLEQAFKLAKKRATNRAYYRRNKEKLNARAHEMRAHRRDYYRKNSEMMRAYYREYRRRNIEKKRACDREHRRRYKEKRDAHINALRLLVRDQKLSAGEAKPAAIDVNPETTADPMKHESGSGEAYE